MSGMHVCEGLLQCCCLHLLISRVESERRERSARVAELQCSSAAGELPLPALMLSSISLSVSSPWDASSGGSIQASPSTDFGGKPCWYEELESDTHS